jgi:hypothetical protein
MTNTVLIKRSGTANSVPTAGQLQAGELAINYADGNLFYKNSSNVVTTIASNKFVSVTGNITGDNLNAAGLSLSGNVVSVLNVTGNINGSNLTTTGSVYGVELWSTNSVGSEGGQLNLSLPASGSTISGGVVIDVYNNLLRFYERSGTNRGAYIDLTAASAGVGSNLLAGGGSTPTQIVNGTSNVVVASSGNVTVGVAGTAAVATFTTAGIVANSVSATNNNTGQNFKVGDDAWIGDVNNADTMSVRGQQNAANGYIVFGNADSTSTLGRAGSGPLTYLGAFSATGNITGNYFIGNGSQLTGIASGSSSNISNGTSNVNINTSGGNISFSVGGTANVVTLDNAGFNFADTTTQDTGINLGRITTSVQGWNLP